MDAVASPAGGLALRDIHLPEPIPWWPPAPGWWLLTLLFVLTVLALFWLYKRHESLRYRRLALAELKSLASEYRHGEDFTVLVKKLSSLLRRTALCHYPKGACAGLTGKRWLEFLDQGFSESPFATGVGRILADGPYGQSASEAERSGVELLALCAQWVKKLPAVSEKGGRE